jgi:hypothetical protein
MILKNLQEKSLFLEKLFMIIKINYLLVILILFIHN